LEWSEFKRVQNKAETARASRRKVGDIKKKPPSSASKKNKKTTNTVSKIGQSARRAHDQNRHADL